MEVWLQMLFSRKVTVSKAIPCRKIWSLESSSAGKYDSKQPSDLWGKLVPKAICREVQFPKLSSAVKYDFQNYPLLENIGF